MVEGRRWTKEKMLYHLSSEEDILVRRAKDGEREAFDELYQKYKRPILNYIYRFIGDFTHAEELTQEVFVRAYINIHRFEPRSKFSSWLYRIAANLSKNHLRHARYEKRLLPLKQESDTASEEATGLEDIQDKAKGPGEIAHSQEIERLVQEGINKLPAHLKEAIILCDIEGLSYEEVADIIGCKPMTVGSRLWRAREKLSKILRYLKDGEG